MKIGQNKENIQKASGTKGLWLKLKDGENLHRVLYGPLPMNTVFWPTVVEQDGKRKQTVRSARVPDSGSIFHQLAAIDRRAQRAQGADDPTSVFDAKTTYNYLVIDKEGAGTLQIAQYPKKVKDQLVEIQAKRDRQSPDKLRYGLIWMFDCIITKAIDNDKGRRYGTDYTVEVDNSPVSGQVPAEWLDLDFDELVKSGNVKPEQFFKKSELKEMEAFDIDVEEATRPHTEAEILDMLSRNPVDLLGKKFGDPAFLDASVIMEELKLLKLPFVEGIEGEVKKALPAASKKAKNMEEAEYREVEETEDDEEETPRIPPKSKKKMKKSTTLSKALEEDDDEDELPSLPKSKDDDEDEEGFFDEEDDDED